MSDYIPGCDMVALFVFCICIKVTQINKFLNVFSQITTHSRLLSQANCRAIASAAGFKSSQSRCISLQEFHTEQQFLKALE